MSLGEAIVRAAQAQRGLPGSCIGQVVNVSFNEVAGEVQLMVGISPDLIPVPLSGWSTTFVERVRAKGRALIGSRVEVSVVSGQPVVRDTLGVI